jgi:putative SOS response-associated peptidase YedK
MAFLMCGRYLLEDEAYADILQILHDIQSAKDRINLDNISRMENLAAGEFPRGEIFPSTLAPVVAKFETKASNHSEVGSAEPGNNYEIVAMKWGFPHWKNSGVIINARAETASEKNMFRRPLKERRCVIPSSGFYEWSYNSGTPDDNSTFLYPGLPHGSINQPRSGKRKPKNKYLFRESCKTTLYMAGISNTFRDVPGIEYDAFTILTTEANDSVEPFHDRMPVILAPDEIDLWISDDAFTGFALHRPGPDLTAILEKSKNTINNIQLSF